MTPFKCHTIAPLAVATVLYIVTGVNIVPNVASGIVSIGCGVASGEPLL